MGWSVNWPVARWSVPDDEKVYGQLRAALAERDALTPAGRLPGPYARLETMESVPPSSQALGQLQTEIDYLLTTDNPWRWWDRTRGQLYTLPTLLADTISQANWTVDLADPASAWACPRPGIYNHLRQATNGLTCVRRLASSAASQRVDSVYELTFGISDWPADRAATLALFDGVDDGINTGLVYDVGLSALLVDTGFEQTWVIDARQMTLSFDTSGLSGHALQGAWLELSTEAPAGATDFSDTFTAEVVASGATRGTFASDETGLKTITLAIGDVNPAGDTVLTLRSTRSPSADRPAWAPSGPDYSSTYREGLDLGADLRLVVEVLFEYRA